MPAQHKHGEHWSLSDEEVKSVDTELDEVADDFQALIDKYSNRGMTLVLLCHYYDPFSNIDWTVTNACGSTVTGDGLIRRFQKDQADSSV